MGMGKILIGYLFVFLNINLMINGHVVDLLPGFAGYLLIFGGLGELSEESREFAGIRPAAAGMGIYTGILFLADLFGIIVNMGIFTWLLNLVTAAVSLYLSWRIIAGIMDLEEKYQADLGAQPLLSAWKAMAVLQILAMFLIWIPAAAIIAAILQVIMTIVFLVAFNNTKKQYEALPDRR